MPAMPQPVQDHPILKRIWKKVNRKNDNHVLAICGDTGSGKSYAALRLGEALDPQFSTDQVAFNSEQFLDIAADDDLGQGRVVVFDEAGVGQSSRKWYSDANIYFNFVLQTWRNRNKIGIFTLPSLGLLDNQSRGLLSAYMGFRDRDHEDEGWTEFKYQRIQTNPKTDKKYYKYPRLRIDGTEKKVMSFRTGMPSETLVDSYEAKKREFQDRLEQAARKHLSDEAKSPMEVRKEVAGKLKELKEEGDLDWTQQEIADICGISQQTVSKI